MSKEPKETKAEPKQKGTAAGVPVYCAHDKIVDTVKMVPNPANPNKHPDDQIKMLAKIIKSSGWRQPITVSNRSGYIVKGHGRLMAAQLAGLDQVPVDYQDYASEAEEYADLIADNRIAELAEVNNKMLADIFAEIDTGEIDLDQTGYKETEIEQIINQLAESVHEELDNDKGDDFDPEPAAAPVSMVGDVWILGRHRVMCGDSTNEKQVAELLDGAQPEILLTDPPYCSGGFQEGGAVIRLDRDEKIRQGRQGNRGKDSKRHTEHKGLPVPDQECAGEQPGDGGLYLYRLENVGISLRLSGELRTGGEVNDRMG